MQGSKKKAKNIMQEKSFYTAPHCVGVTHRGEQNVHIHCGDALKVLRTLPPESVHCCVTSPPYYRLRDYGLGGQIGHEETPKDYILQLVKVFREVRRVLRSDGTLWIKIGDS